MEPSTNHLLMESASSFQEWLSIPSSNLICSTFPTTSLVENLDPKAFVTEYWEQNTRPDGRLFSQGRPTKVVSGLLNHSSGSALVTLGERDGTKVMAATSFSIGQPSPEQPDEGEILVHVSGTGGKNAMSDSKSEQHKWDTLQTWLQRTMEQDESMVQSLNLLTGRACLRLNYTIIVLEDNGNVRDSAFLACMAAWRDTRLPVVGHDLIEIQGRLWWKSKERAATLPTGSNVVKEKEKGKRSDQHYRSSLTMGVWIHPIDHTTHLITDPCSREESILQGNITVIVNAATDTIQVDHTGDVPLSPSDIALATKLAKGRAKAVEDILL